MVQEPTTRTLPHKPAQRGQALVEYALILVLVVMALVAAVAATGPALGNVFSNTVFNLVGITGTPQDLYSMGGPVAFWATVTWVAGNTPNARSFPQSPPKPPTSTFTAGPPPTATIMTPSATPTSTPTLPPTPTATDAGFNVPYVDSIDQPVLWRVDSSVYLGGSDWFGEYYPNTTLSGTPDRSLYNQQIDPAYRFNLNFNWITDSPLDSWLSDNYSIRFTRKIDIQPGANPVTLNFTLDSDDGSRLLIDGVKVLDYWSGHSAGNPQTYSKTFTPGTSHTIVVEYYEATGNASLSLAIGTNKGNVKADVTNPSGGAANCPWTQINGSQPNTVSYAWKENLPTVANGFPQSMHCNLELRGFVDLTGVVNPTMSFWDMWDFGTTSDTSLKLQLAPYAAYNADLSGGPNWAAGTTISLHTAGKNYAWTRNEFAIPASLGKQVTWRFVMDSGSASSIRRWYLDDIRLDAAATQKTFGVCTVNKYTCGNYWDLDNTAEKADFQTSGRWDLTNKNVASNDAGSPSMSWDISSTGVGGTDGLYATSGSTAAAASTDNRVHYVAFNGQVDLRSIAADGSGGTPDWEGDLGYPILSFYYAYGLASGDSIEVQYTRDADTPGTPANWARVGPSAIQSVAVGNPTVTGAMKRYDLQLKAIPFWNTQTFRLRFALISDNNIQSTGFYIDNIAIEREGLMKYADYPFCDDAEGGTDQWLMGGQWGIASTTGAFHTGNSFSDSPLGNYVNGQATSMTMRYPIDFNNDTPENLTNWGGNHSCLDGSTIPGKATHPVLTFWQWRKLGSSKSYRIELFRNAHSATGTTPIGPIAVWNYTYSSGNSTQVVWEREEVDMGAAILKATGLTLAQLAATPDKYDDDFYLQFTFDALSGSSVSDGIYIDNLVMQEYSETSFKLWSPSTNYAAKAGAPVAGKGDGTNWVDDIDNPADWYNRWTTGGNWTAVNWDAHSGITSMHDNDVQGDTYLQQSFNVMEMNKILDLRGAVSTDLPTLYFWTHYNISAGDWISVDAAVQDETEMTTVPAPRSTMGYDYQYLWGTAASYGGGSTVTSWGGGSSWQSIWDSGMTGSNKGLATRNDAWTRKQVDLRNFAGKRVKIRFVLNALSPTNIGGGWWLDDIQFTFRTNNVFTVGFTDKAQNMSNWIAEGKWGLAPDQWRGTGGGPADLGSNAWNAFWFDCIQWTLEPTKTAPQPSTELAQKNCNAGNWTTFFGNVPRTVAATNAWIDARTPASTSQLVAGLHFVKDAVADIDYDFGSTGKPPTTTDNSWLTYYGARFFRTVTVSGGQYTFITTSNDGVNVHIEDSTGAIPAGLSTSNYWNVINNWSTRTSAAVDYQAVTLPAGTYQIIVEYFQSTAKAAIQLQIGTNKFSFSDSPSASSTSTAVNSIPFSDSSLILNGVFNLNTPAGYTAAQWKPRLEFYELYFFNSNSQGSVEVSPDGGFTWTQTGLIDATTCPIAATQCDPNTAGYNDWRPQSGKDWQLRSHDLDNYVNQNIGLRFRMHVASLTADGWWITDVTLGNAGG